MKRPHALRGLAVVLALTAAMGCGGTLTPTASAGGFSDVIAELVLRRVTVHEQVSGEDGCERVPLHDNGTRLQVSTATSVDRRDVYLFRWRRQSDFVASATTFFMCVGDFQSNHQGETVDVVEESPWRAFGTDWSDEVESAVRESLRATSGR